MHDAPSTIDGPRRCHSHRREATSSEDHRQQPSWLVPGETVHAQIEVDAWRYLALDVPYDRRTILYGGPIGWTISAIASAIGNRRTRHAAERLAAPQWRYLGHLPIIITNRRLLVAYEGQWWPIWFEMIERCDVTDDTAIATFHEDAPYYLRGIDLASAFAAIGLRSAA